MLLWLLPDPADGIAQACRDLGLLRQLQQPRGLHPDPSNGGLRGFDVWYRRDQLARSDNNELIIQY
jgi:hypothetical protein